jgi:Family of unknown function (DUF6452)
MIRRTEKYLLVAFVLCAMLWTACTQQRSPCLTPKIASFTIETMHLPIDTSTVFVDSALPSAVFTALTKTGKQETIFPLESIFTISLSSDTGYCQWLFTTDSLNTNFDTMTFFYKRDLQFLSNACGYTYFYTLDSVRAKGTMIDSVHITNTSVTNNANTTKNLQVFIHPDF